MNKILLSFIVPVYNVEKYLDQCLTSLLHLNIDSYEVIIVNDGSTDRSAEIANKYVNKYANISLLNKENGGLSSARNFGMNYVNGKYVWFVDSDDYILGQSLPEIIDLLEKYDAEVICFNGFDFFPDHTQKIIRKNVTFENKVLRGPELFRKLLTTKAYAQPVWLYIYNVTFLANTQITFIEGIYHEDEPYTAEILSCANRILIINQIMYAHRMRQGSIMGQSITKKHIEDIVQITQFYKQLSLKYQENKKIYQYCVYRVLKTLLYRVNICKMNPVLSVYKKHIYYVNPISNNYFSIKEKLEYLRVYIKLRLI